MQIGDTVKLVRKISKDILEVELTAYLVKLATPAVEVRWKSDRYRYKLDLIKDEVLAIEATQSHRQTMRSWYSVLESDRKALTESFWLEKKKGGR